jgi:hypothetical protein
MPDVTYILQRYRGSTPVMIYNEKTRQKIAAKQEFWVSPGNELVGELEDLLGSGAVKVVEKG